MSLQSQDKGARLCLLREAVDAWLSMASVNRNTVALEFLQTIEASGFDELEFSRRDDLSDRARVTAQKLFRWMGYDEALEPSLERLFVIEALLLAAMPSLIRLEYLSKVYPFVVVGPLLPSDSDEVVMRTAALDYVERNNDAQKALMDYVTEPRVARLAKLKQRVSTANASGRNVMKVAENIEKSIRFCLRVDDGPSALGRFVDWVKGWFGR